MKIRVPGDTPTDRLANLTRGVLAVSKHDIDRQRPKISSRKPRRRKK